MNVGKVTISQFKRGLEGLQISTLGRLYLAEPEINALVTLYKDPNDPDRVCWRTFADDIDQGKYFSNFLCKVYLLVVSCMFTFRIYICYLLTFELEL